MRWQIAKRDADDPHAKAGLLLQAHLGRQPLPVSDYSTDTRSVLDNSLRVLQVNYTHADSPGQVWLMYADSTAQGFNFIDRSR